jgi:Domain of unknown function (DUF4129)
MIHPAFLLIICWFTLSPVTLAMAAQSIEPQQAKQYITEILQQPEFQTKKTECHWDYQEAATSQPISQPPKHAMEIDINWIGAIAQLLEILLWIFLGMMIWLLFIYGSRWLEQLRPSQINKKSTFTPTPRLLDKTPPLSGLPPAIPQHAWKLWQAGEKQAALSLLYCGALSVLNTRHGLAIQASATENECLRFVKQQQSPELIHYFSQLIQIWQQIAYAHRLPQDTEVQSLCEKWPHYFAAGESTKSPIP